MHACAHEPFLGNHFYEETTTTEKLEPVIESSAPEQQPGQKGSSSFPADLKKITDKEREFIDLEVDRASKAGEIKTTKARYRAGLEKKAKRNELNIEDLESLKAPSSQDRRPNPQRQPQDKKDQELASTKAEISKIIESRKGQGETLQEISDQIVFFKNHEFKNQDLVDRAVQQLCPDEYSESKRKSMLYIQCLREFRPAKKKEALDTLESLDSYLGQMVKNEMNGFVAVQ